MGLDFFNERSTHHKQNNQKKRKEKEESTRVFQKIRIGKRKWMEEEILLVSIGDGEGRGVPTLQIMVVWMEKGGKKERMPRYQTKLG